MKVLLAIGSFGSFFDLVARGGLLVGPALRKFFDRVDLLIDDGLLLNRWSEDLESCVSQLIDQQLQILFFQPAQRVHGSLGIGMLKKVQELQTRGRQALREAKRDPLVKISG